MKFSWIVPKRAERCGIEKRWRLKSGTLENNKNEFFKTLKRRVDNLAFPQNS